MHEFPSRAFNLSVELPALRNAGGAGAAGRQRGLLAATECVAGVPDKVSGEGDPLRRFGSELGLPAEAWPACRADELSVRVASRRSCGLRKASEAAGIESFEATPRARNRARAASAGLVGGEVAGSVSSRSGVSVRDKRACMPWRLELVTAAPRTLPDSSGVWLRDGTGEDATELRRDDEAVARTLTNTKEAIDERQQGRSSQMRKACAHACVAEHPSRHVQWTMRACLVPRDTCATGTPSRRPMPATSSDRTGWFPARSSNSTLMIRAKKPSCVMHRPRGFHMTWSRHIADAAPSGRDGSSASSTVLLACMSIARRLSTALIELALFLCRFLPGTRTPSRSRTLAAAPRGPVSSPCTLSQPQPLLQLRTLRLRTAEKVATLTLMSTAAG